MSMRNFFPLETMRPKQAKVLEELDQALKSNYKFINSTAFFAAIIILGYYLRINIPL